MRQNRPHIRLDGPDGHHYCTIGRFQATGPFVKCNRKIESRAGEANDLLEVTPGTRPAPAATSVADSDPTCHPRQALSVKCVSEPVNVR